MNMPPFHKILATSALCLAAVGACALSAAETEAPTLVGKVLVLKIKDTCLLYTSDAADESLPV